MCLCTYWCVCVCCFSWSGRSLLLSAEWLMEINVWFAGYLIKDLMLEHAPPPTPPCRTHSNKIALSSPFAPFALVRAGVCEVVVFTSACLCVCGFAEGQQVSCDHLTRLVCTHCWLELPKFPVGLLLWSHRSDGDNPSRSACCLLI